MPATDRDAAILIFDEKGQECQILLVLCEHIPFTEIHKRRVFCLTNSKQCICSCGPLSIKQTTCSACFHERCADCKIVKL